MWCSRKWQPIYTMYIYYNYKTPLWTIMHSIKWSIYCECFTERNIMGHTQYVYTVMLIHYNAIASAQLSRTYNNYRRLSTWAPSLHHDWYNYYHAYNFHITLYHSSRDAVDAERGLERIECRITHYPPRNSTAIVNAVTAPLQYSNPRFSRVEVVGESLWLFKCRKSNSGEKIEVECVL